MILVICSDFSDFLKLQQLLPDTSRHSNWRKLTFQTESLKITQNLSGWLKRVTPREISSRRSRWSQRELSRTRISTFADESTTFGKLSIWKTVNLENCQFSLLPTCCGRWRARQPGTVFVQLAEAHRPAMFRQRIGGSKRPFSLKLPHARAS